MYKYCEEFSLIEILALSLNLKLSVKQNKILCYKINCLANNCLARNFSHLLTSRILKNFSLKMQKYKKLNKTILELTLDEEIRITIDFMKYFHGNFNHSRYEQRFNDLDNRWIYVCICYCIDPNN